MGALGVHPSYNVHTNTSVNLGIARGNSIHNKHKRKMLFFSDVY